MTTDILTAIGALVVILQAATRIPRALTELLRDLASVVAAVRDLHTTLTTHQRYPSSRNRTARTSARIRSRTSKKRT
ncbi:hypothetical protein ACQP0C_31045 [Nocardia sp. CA-129566]|uniref:hypothetical protein n=1 Tax=Nocardia sp. CA-129566 TaxID=3239976 RepID=UPI003D98FED5